MCGGRANRSDRDGGPVDPAPDIGDRKILEPHRACGGPTGWTDESTSVSFRCRSSGAGGEPQAETAGHMGPALPDAKHYGEIRKALRTAGTARSEAERAEIEVQVNPSTTPSTRRSRYAGAQLFKLQCPAQGRRGHRSPPNRLARLLLHEDAARTGRIFVKSAFFSTAPAATFLWQDKEKWGPESPGNHRPSEKKQTRASARKGSLTPSAPSGPSGPCPHRRR